MQWKVSEGGNGHWYEFIRRSEIVCWPEARDASADKSGHLVTLASVAENEFVKSLVASNDPGVLEGGPFIGAFCGAGSWGEWSWVTAEPFSFTAWSPGEPNNAGDGECYVHYWRWSSLGWNDTSACSSRSFVVEWDADCNHDGIVDYGQCHDGTLPDYDGNNIPDCCETGTPCVVGKYPMQWRMDEGGNGHWYAATNAGSFLTWSDAQRRCNAQGGALASLGTQPEDDWVFRSIASDVRYWAYNGPYVVGPWIGARGASGYWRWDDGTAWSFAAWLTGEGPPSPDPQEQFAHFFAGPGALTPTNAWGDYFDVLVTQSYLTEWSADCNHDNIVDYGQILLGQLVDTNTNGIPDICELPTCRDVDLFRNGVINGADLGILLSEWGPASANTVSDINRDGRVDGSDLGTLLAFWGPCSP